MLFANPAGSGGRLCVTVTRAGSSWSCWRESVRPNHSMKPTVHCEATSARLLSTLPAAYLILVRRTGQRYVLHCRNASRNTRPIPRHDTRNRRWLRHTVLADRRRQDYERCHHRRFEQQESIRASKGRRLLESFCRAPSARQATLASQIERKARQIAARAKKSNQWVQRPGVLLTLTT